MRGEKPGSLYLFSIVNITPKEKECQLYGKQSPSLGSRVIPVFYAARFSFLSSTLDKVLHKPPRIYEGVMGALLSLCQTNTGPL